MPIFIVLVLITLITLLTCGILYINEHFFMSTDASFSKEMSTIVTVDAGHGGIQPGCEFDNVLEKDITLTVSLLLKEELKSQDITVILTRSSDETVDLEKRCEIANAANSDFFVSIHCNSFVEDVSINGFEGYYYNNSQGKQLAELILQAAQSHSIKTRYIHEENYRVLRDTNMPSVLLEIGFLSNKVEREKLQNTDYQAEIAKSIAEGIIKMIE